jgi:hypothetical protein
MSTFIASPLPGHGAERRTAAHSLLPRRAPRPLAGVPHLLQAAQRRFHHDGGADALDQRRGRHPCRRGEPPGELIAAYGPRDPSVHAARQRASSGSGSGESSGSISLWLARSATVRASSSTRLEGKRRQDRGKARTCTVAFTLTREISRPLALRYGRVQSSFLDTILPVRYHGGASALWSVETGAHRSDEVSA